MPSETRGYYEFLAARSMDPSFIVDLPLSGWPFRNPPHLHSLQNSNVVLALMLNLPDIADKSYSDYSQVLPGDPLDWANPAIHLFDDGR